METASRQANLLQRFATLFVERFRALSWKHWTIATRLLFVALFPITYFFISVVSYSYYSRISEVEQELAERGKSIATAIAEGAEYHLAAGHLGELNSNINSIAQTDENIYRIDILDTERHVLTQSTVSTKNLPQHRSIEAIIKKPVVWIYLLTPESKPSGNNAEPHKNHHQAEVLGAVRVTMSATPALKKQTSRFYVEAALALLALFVSGLLGHFLARSLNSPLRTSMNALHAIELGNYSLQLPITAGGEIGQLQDSINKMAVSLLESKQHLEEKVQARTVELTISRNAALKADAEKRRLIQQIQTIIEEERKSIAIEIHDELNASLIAARLDSQRILHLIEKTSVPNALLHRDQQIQEKARAIIKTLLDLYANGRKLVRRLRPEVLELLGLEGALEEMLRHYQSEQCHFALDVEGNFSEVAQSVSISIYRIVQEALSNIIKHAQASQVTIKLHLQQSAHELRLELIDNGIGFNATEPASGVGLMGMRERVLALNGTIHIESSNEHGTSIVISIPMSNGPQIAASEK